VHYQRSYSSQEDGNPNLRLRLAAIFVVIGAAVVGLRLFGLMILQHSFYTALAAGTQEVYNQLFPTRGEVFIQDSRTGEEYPLAINRDYFIVFADTREIKDDATAEKVAEKLTEVFSYTDEKKLALYYQLNQRADAYVPIELKIDEETMDKIKELDLTGIYLRRQSHRYYPEGSLAASVIGFLGKTDDGSDTGHYGIEGYWQQELAGSGGFFEGLKSASGFWLPLAGRSLKSAVDGADLFLTIDRTLQFMACEKLKKAQEEYGATSAALIILDPATGAIRAMCSEPDFDPNSYNKVDSVEVYNNTAIFTPYEPGSIFKPIVMAAAINEGLVGPESTFFDSGSQDGLCITPIKNAMEKSYGRQTMTGVLENSINTGMVEAVKKLGKKKLIEYLEKFGFGLATGIELQTETGGSLATLSERQGDQIDCYGATASFGQGITVNPLQMISAFAAIANGGKLMRPYLVEEIRYSDGRHEKIKPKEIREVLQKKTALLIGGMLTSVVDNGQGKNARVDGYYVAGKTGTAQIPGRGGYTDETNHSFIGFAPADNPKFVMLVKFEKPKRAWADGTAAPLFADIAKFALQYYQVPPGR
jgi:cell division protein FtsI/penicillin-binding protein 2